MEKKNNDQSKLNNQRKISFLVLTGLFFIWGFIISMNDILIPYFKGIFELSYFQAMLVQFAFFGSFFIGSLIYFILSVKTGDPIAKIGYRNGMAGGLFLAGIGCLLFYPAASLHSYGFFLGALFCLGLGITFLQIAANPYAALLGPEKTASSRLNLAQGVNSLGTVTGPLLGGYLIFQYFFDPVSSEADSVRIPYLVFAVIFILVSIIIRITPFPEFHRSESPEKGLGVFRYPQLLLGVAAIFASIGAEVATGSLLINFFGMEDIAGMNEAKASQYVAFYWGGLMIGRLLGAVSFSDNSPKKKILYSGIIVATALGVIFLSNGIYITGIFTFLIMLNLFAFRIGCSLPGKTVGVFSLNIIILLIIAFFSKGQLAMWSVIGIGLFASIMWSNIFTLAIRGLGKFTSQGSSLLIMAILGAAIIPPIQGMAADSFGIQNSFIVILACHLFVAWYGLAGSKKMKQADNV
ncbi:MAG: sugar MFS transporter [Tannerella sp.]|jgi:FHS family L-fucose permease-like MFS transporter|nr:sugar MFS transporter [Tannerella sp.]